MATIYKSAASVMMSAFAAEAEYATVEAVDIRTLMGQSWTDFVPVSNNVTDEGMVNGLEGPTVVDTVTKHYENTFQLDKVYPNTFAALMAYALGSCTSSTLDTSGFQHLLADDDNDRVMESFTTEVRKVAGTTNDKYAGCLVTTLNLSMTKNQPMTMSASIVAKTRTKDGTGTTAMITTEPAMMGYGVWGWLGDEMIAAGYVPVIGSCMLDDTDATTTTNNINLSDATNHLLTGFNLTITNITDITNLFSFTDDEIIRPVRNERTVTGDFSYESQDSTIADAMQANTLRALQVDWLSDTKAGATIKQGFQIIIPKFRTTGATSDWGADNRLSGTVNFEAMDDVTNGHIVVTVNNKQTTYKVES